MDTRLTFSLLFLLPLYSLAQSEAKDVEQQTFLWLRYSNRLTINEHWLLYSEVEGRWFAFTDRLHQWVLPRVQMHYQVNKTTDVALGNTFFLQALPQTADEAVDRIRPEIRPHQELNFSQPLGKLKISHRYKIEERFFQRTSVDEPDFSFRFRYRLQVQIPITNPEKRFPVSLRVFDEVMFNAGKNIVHNVFDQNRIFADCQVKLAPEWTIEMGYMNWFQQRPTGNDFFNRHIGRITVAHSLNLKEH
uniref:DUF2490 domain-containing protein n=1 Tax=Roseihalotalea indica TaxID=2867963 RepID=A0AA49GUW5_9BACT|nr:DUF2490 domain-containing protein [Tunicatimonas sp. TK19036]